MLQVGQQVMVVGNVHFGALAKVVEQIKLAEAEWPVYRVEPALWFGGVEVTFPQRELAVLEEVVVADLAMARKLEM